MNFTILPASFLVGLLIGLTSMGGSALMTPFLILIVGIRPVLAVGTDLAYNSITKLFGAWVHWRQGTVDLKVVLRLACGSVPGGILGALAVNQLHRTSLGADHYIRSALGLGLVVVALVILIQTFTGNVFSRAGFDTSRLQRWAVIPWGAMVGFSVGFTSLGSGSLVAPFLLLLFQMSAARVVGTTIFHAAILTIVAALFHSSAGHVDWQLTPVLLAGAIPGIMLGSYLVPRLPQRAPLAASRRS